MSEQISPCLEDYTCCRAPLQRKEGPLRPIRKCKSQSTELTVLEGQQKVESTLRALTLGTNTASEPVQEWTGGAAGAVEGTVAKQVPNRPLQVQELTLEGNPPISIQNPKWTTSWMNLSKIIWKEIILWIVYVVRRRLLPNVCFPSSCFIQKNVIVTSTY